MQHKCILFVFVSHLRPVFELGGINAGQCACPTSGVFNDVPNFIFTLEVMYSHVYLIIL